MTAPRADGFAFREGEVWAARDGVLARFVRFSERGPENRKPVCLGGTAYVKPGAAVDVALRCSDPDGDGVTVEVTRPPALGALTVNAEGTGRYTAGATRGDDTIRFRASDGRDWSDEAVLTVKVDDLAPVCQSRRSDYRVPFQTEVRLECTDPEGGPVTTQIVTPPDRGTLTGSTFALRGARVGGDHADLHGHRRGRERVGAGDGDVRHDLRPAPAAPGSVDAEPGQRPAADHLPAQLRAGPARLRAGHDHLPAGLGQRVHR